MKNWSLNFFCIITILVIISGICNANEMKIQMVQNAISNNQLVMNFQADNVFNEKVTKFLDRGFTIRIEYKIELWQSRKYWFDRLHNQYKMIYQMKFEPLEKRYECVRKQQGEVIDSKLTPNRELIIQWATKIDRMLNIAPIGQLDQNSSYYYSIEIILITLTSENIKDLQKWLGEFSGEREEPSTLTKTTFKVATDFISSRNSKKTSMRSERFYLQNLPRIQNKKEITTGKHGFSRILLTKLNNIDILTNI